jgi:hypothetical protein
MEDPDELDEEQHKQSDEVDAQEEKRPLYRTSQFDARHSQSPLRKDHKARHDVFVTDHA